MANAKLRSYAQKAATDYHKAFARWLVTEVGYDPDKASPRAAFLKGVSLAITARAPFMESDFLADWREKNGITKRGPKSRTAEEDAPARSSRSRNTAKSRRVREETPDDDFDDVDADDLDDDDLDDDDIDASDDDDFDDDDADDDDEDDDEPEEAPAPRRRGRPAKKAAAPAKRTAARKTAAPARRSKAAAVKDDDFVF